MFPFRWLRCKTIALQPNPKDTTLISCLVTTRGKHYNMNLPFAYYNNALAFPILCSEAETLRKSSLGYVVELVKRAKDKMREEYKRSFGNDLMLIKRR